MRQMLCAFCALGVLLLGLMLAGCERPGEGAKATAGYAAAEPLIAGLQSYHQQTGHYPPALADLAPAFMAEIPTLPDGGPFQYKPGSDGQSYELTFRYTGPGMNVCTHTPSTRWRCYGYY